MPVKIRLSRKGRKKAPFYHIVVADARAPRDGKFIQKIGTYNPMTKPATIEVDRDAAFDWLMKGAQPTDTVKAILGFKGVYFKKHLMRGVKKGALTIEQADTMYQEWIDTKEARIIARREQSASDLIQYRKNVSGVEKAAKVIVADESSKDAAEAFKVTSNEVKEVEIAVAETESVVEVAEVAVEETENVAEVAEVAVEETEKVVDEVVVDANNSEDSHVNEEASEETTPEEEA